MSRPNGRSWLLPVAAATIVLLAFAIIWFAAPEDLRGLVILAGGVVTAALYLGLYALQRARHW
jgi:hypothetical protein